jgi:hypothetical protein
MTYARLRSHVAVLHWHATKTAVFTRRLQDIDLHGGVGILQQQAQFDIFTKQVLLLFLRILRSSSAELPTFLVAHPHRAILDDLLDDVYD